MISRARLRSAPPAPVEDPCLAALDPIDALKVGQTLRSLVESGRTPPGAAESCARVGNALVDAAHAKFKERRRRGGGS